ncbi:hypothetical protein DPMN_170104 [Dreissena polymorpha]|uniref:B box-type domain-containing protein n=1 Tax=Dreissena polymorpha TaxID=45954 RepID=A0A9D4DZ65_DREPO|nr:hypothetical protein DPMN_170104 [Dreissena polymorpha]
MADGINTFTPFRDGSDIVLDYCCYVCEQNGVQKEATQHCKQCSKCYCDTCVPLHDLMSKTHSLVGRAKMASCQDNSRLSNTVSGTQQSNYYLVLR